VPLFVEHARSALSRSATARLMAFSRSELRMRQAYPGLYSKGLRNFGGRLSCQEQVLDVVFLGMAVGHAFASLRANSALSIELGWSLVYLPAPASSDAADI